MRSRPPRTILPLQLSGLLTALAGCAGCERDGGAPAPAPAAGADQPRQGGQVVIALGSDIGGLAEPTVPSSQVTSEVLRRLFLTLADELPDFKTVVPRLAESWEFSDEHKTLTFHLRDGVRWSDGLPVTAEDVEFSYRAWTDPDVAWDGAFSLEAVDRVEVIDPRTVAFHFSQANSTQLLDVAAGAVILPAHAWGELPFAEWRQSADWFRDHLVTDGPFRLVSWTPQQEIVLERNPDYYEEGLPHLDRVVLRVIPDQSSQLTQLLNGQVDFVLQLSPDDAPKVEAAPDTRLEPFWTRGAIFIGWNLRRPMFADARVRRALTLGIDRRTLVDSIWGRFARVIGSPILPDTWAYDPELEPLPYDPDAARRLLADAGWEDADGDGIRDKAGRPFAFDLATNTGNQQREDALVLIQNQLRRIGVEARPQAIEFNTLIAEMQDAGFDAVVSGWVIPTTFDFRFAYHSDEIGSSNVIGYSDPELDAALDAVRREPERADTRPYLDTLQRIQRRDQPYTFLWQSQRLTGVRRQVHGAAPNHLYSLGNLRQWWVEAEPETP